MKLEQYNAYIAHLVAQMQQDNDYMAYVMLKGA